MIEQRFLNDVAGYVDRRIHSVLLNDSYRISDFHVKEVQQSTVAMEFMVPFGSVETITKIDLQDDQMNVISTNVVNVPITSDTVIIQSFDVKEG